MRITEKPSLPTISIPTYGGQAAQSVYGSSIITFDNQSGDPALVRLMGQHEVRSSCPTAVEARSIAWPLAITLSTFVTATLVDTVTHVAIVSMCGIATALLHDLDYPAYGGVGKLWIPR